MNLFQKKTILLSTGVILFFFISLLYGLSEPIKNDGVLSVSLLAVGQGDAIFIETPNNTQILVDAGPKDVVMTKLGSVMPSFDTSLDMIVITNPDSDHISGFTHILEKYTVESALVSGTRSQTETYKNLETLLDQKQVKKLAGYKDMKIVLDETYGVYLEILFPDQVVRGWERNDGSLVMKLVYGKTSLMLMGDATTLTEKLILENTNTSLQSDIIKIGHHGSKTSTSDAWLDAVKPSIALLSFGANNRYGHPHQEVVERLSERNIEMFDTTQGTVQFISEGELWEKRDL